MGSPNYFKFYLTKKINMIAKEKTSKADLARQYRTKYGAEMPTLKLARILYKDNKLLYKDVEDCRNSLRYIEGKSAKSKFNADEISKFVIKEDRVKNPYSLPKSDETDYKPYVLKGHKRLGILSDIHVPYHNIEALTTAITYLKKQKIDGLILNGDTIDCHRLSRFIKDPKKRNFKLELDTFKELFNVLEKQLKCKIYFKLGNHEERYEHFLYEKAGELVGIEEFEFENIIKARARGIEVIGEKRIIKANSLNIIHGHEFIGGISAPVNIARGLYLKGKVSAVQGHNHNTSEHTEPDMNGKITTTWSVGCLCELHPAYMPLNKWNHGFADIDLDDNGQDFEFRNKRIYKGKIL
jgi:predicted phosphodiesterase